MDPRLLWGVHADRSLRPSLVPLPPGVSCEGPGTTGRPEREAALFAAVWPETAVTEGVLAVCIRKLRRALDDEAQRPHYIETVHRRGYRFTAELRVPPAAVGAPAAAAPSRLVQVPGIVGDDEWEALQPQVQEMTQNRLLRELAEALEALAATAEGAG